MNKFRKIFSNLALDFTLLLILATAVAFLSLIGMQQLNNVFQDTVQNDFEAYVIAKDMEIDLLQARRREKDFLLRWQTVDGENDSAEYVAQNQEHMAQLRQHVSELEVIMSNDDRLREANDITVEMAQIFPLIDLYNEQFLLVVAGTDARGFVDTGYEGALREAIHQIEEVFKEEAELKDLELILLNLRRREKDYFLRSDMQYVEEVYDLVTQLEFELENSGLPRQKEFQLRQYLADYQENFQNVVAIDQEVAQATQKLRTAAHDINPILESIGVKVVRQIKFNIDSSQVVTRQTSLIVTFTVFGLIGFGLILIYLLLTALRAKSD